MASRGGRRASWGPEPGEEGTRRTSQSSGGSASRRRRRKPRRGGGGGGGGGGSGGGASRGAGTRRRRSEPKWVPPPNARSIWHEPGSKEDMLQQMAILRWRRNEIDARMKDVIAGTRSMQEQDMMVGLAVDRTAERAQWMQGVIREELERPLYFDKVALMQLEAAAAREAEASRRQVDQHNKLLDSVRYNVLRRDPALVKAGLNSTTATDDAGRGPLAGMSTMKPTLSLPALGASSGLGAASRKQLEQLEGINKELARNRRKLKSKDDIVKSVTRTANTHLKKKKKRGRGATRGRGLGDTQGTQGTLSTLSTGSMNGPQSRSLSPPVDGGTPGIRVGASALSPAQ